MIRVVPPATAVTTPLGLTVAMPLLRLDHVAVAPATRFARASRMVSVATLVWPMAPSRMVSVVASATASCRTTTFRVATALSTVTSTVAGPSWSARTRPVAVSSIASAFAPLPMAKTSGTLRMVSPRVVSATAVTSSVAPRLLSVSADGA